MKYLFEIGNDKTLVLTAHQLELLVAAIDDSEMLVNKHVGDKNGTHGYNNCYVHDVQNKRAHEWLSVRPVAEDYLDTLKFAAKLENDK
jgi:hypothetical protein